MATRWTEDDLRAKGFTIVGPLGQAVTIPLLPKRPKYGNRKVTDASGAVHDSTKEYKRWCELQLRERNGEITGLRRQVPFALVVNDVLVCSYEADAVYHEGAALIVEDTKSAITRKKRDYRIKVKLMQAIHGLQIREV